VKWWCNSHNSFCKWFGKQVKLDSRWLPGKVYTTCDAFCPGGRGGILICCDIVDLDEVGLEIVNDDEEFSAAPDRGDVGSP